MSNPSHEGVITRRGAAGVGVASIVAAASGYVVLVVVARRLSLAANSEFLVFWSALFGGFGVLGGIQQEATRSVGSAAQHDLQGRGARIVGWALVLGAVLMLAVAGSSPLWFDRFLPGQSAVTLAVLAFAGLAFTGHVAVVGALAGGRAWTSSATLVGGESALRLLVVVAAALAGAGLVGLELASAVSAGFWILAAMAMPTVRRAIGARGDSRPGPFVSHCVQAMLGTAGAALLVVGYPILMRATTDGDVWASAAPLVLAVSLTRAPLLIPLNAYQGVAISYFLDSRRRPGRALAAVSLLIAGAGVVLGALAWFVGPALMAAFFGPAYRVAGVTLAELTLGAAALAVLTLTGACVLALGRHVVYASGWLVAAAVATGLLFLHMPLEHRVVLSLVVGPFVGAMLHVVGTTTSEARRVPSATHPEVRASAARPASSNSVEE